MTFQTSALILSWVAILLLALVVSGLVRQVHALSNGTTRPTEAIGPPPGSAAPEFRRLAPHHPEPMVLLFLDSDCRTCSEVLAEATRTAPAPGVTVRALFRGVAPETGRLPAHGGEAVLFDRYDAVATPFAVVIDPAGTVVHSEPLGSHTAFRTLLDQLSGDVEVTSPGGTS
ncbi:MAG TPA: hypothetical protein VHJ83_04080 [Micromonosporaceae bacterium]|jgi:hypothetical protein|nr:hypothetical protein [Micromonosporaceae bacterium]